MNFEKVFYDQLGVQIVLDSFFEKGAKVESLNPHIKLLV